ncbi:MAG: hypothetical protein ABIO92_05935 [Chloroflexia bacterium]
MSRARASLTAMFAEVMRGFWTLRFPLLLLVSLLLWIVAYQAKSTYTVDVGGLTDDAYITGFHAKEQTPELTYRWSRGSSTVDLPGVGNQPVKLSIRVTGFRPDGAPPKLTLEARGQTFDLQTAAVPQSYTFFVDRGDRWDGDFRLSFASPTFSPPGDARELGALVDSIVVETAEFGLRPFVIPPLWALGSLLLGLVLAYVCALVTLQRQMVSLALIAGIACTVALLIIFARPELGLLARGLPGLMTWILAVAVAGRLFMDVSLTGTDRQRSRWVVALGSSSAALAFVLRFGGLTYPQFLTSDLLLHVHNAQSVMRGELLLMENLPDGTPVPYPPALYLLVTPLAALFGSSDDTLGLLLKWLISMLDASTCLALAWAGARIAGRAAGGLAALAYALSSAPFELMSAGNYSNLFGQAVFNLTMLGGLVYVGTRAEHKIKSGPLVLLAAGFFLTALGHYGMMLSALVVMGLFAILTMWAGARRHEIGCSIQLLGAFAVSLVGGILLFYINFAKEIVEQFTTLFQRVTSEKTSGGSTSLPTLPANVEALHERLGRKLARLSGLLPLMAGAWGWLMTGPMPLQARNLLLAWLGASGFFFLLDQALGDAIRWYYLAAAPLSLLAGRFLGLLAGRGRVARALVTLSFGVMLLQLLYIWVGDLIFTRYH